MLVLSASKADYRTAVMAVALDTESKIRNVAEQVGIETIDYLRSFIVSTDGFNRHPGHWKTITGQLAGGYAWRVEPIPGGWRLTLENPVEYAGHLEAHDGYFVLGGIADPGGPVHDVLKSVAALVAPEWTVTVA